MDNYIYKYPPKIFIIIKIQVPVTSRILSIILRHVSGGGRHSLNIQRSILLHYSLTHIDGALVQTI